MTNKAQNNALTLITCKVQKNQKVRGFFSEGDKILTGVSGGKDSLLLLEVLGELSKKRNFKVQIVPVHIKIKDIGYNINFDAIDEICKHYHFKLHIIESSIDFDPTHKKGPCFVCSWHRRKLLYSTAREMGCNKIALGHHMDDAVQTLLMNMIYHGSISSMPARLSMFQGELQIIRPLLFISEKEIIDYKNIRKFPELIKDCPYGSDTKRNTVKELIAELEKINPTATLNIFRSMSKIFPAYLPECGKGITEGWNEIHPPKGKQEDYS
jgi:tRNA(Ile)-lysidine synthase TilS/MesJ